MISVFETPDSVYLEKLTELYDEFMNEPEGFADSARRMLVNRVDYVTRKHEEDEYRKYITKYQKVWNWFIDFYSHGAWGSIKEFLKYVVQFTYYSNHWNNVDEELKSFWYELTKYQETNYTKVPLNNRILALSESLRELMNQKTMTASLKKRSKRSTKRTKKKKRSKRSTKRTKKKKQKKTKRKSKVR